MTESDGTGAVIFLGILSLITIFIGRKREFFSFPSPTRTLLSQIRWTHVVSVFALYFLISYFVSPIFGKFLQPFLLTDSRTASFLKYASWVHFFNSSVILLALACFLWKIPSSLRNEIWLPSDETPHSFKKDVQCACLAWLISFPLVLFINQLIDWILATFFQIHHIPEQLAVYFLKLTFGYPLYLFLTVFTIVIFAPLIEETLFRGFLQSLIRKHLGPKQAIVITSFLFAFFHYSPEQAIANITIIASLFTFSLFLGFVYEKRGSLFCSIVLHSLFNAVNVFNLYFLGGISENSGFVAFINFFSSFQK